MSMVCTIQGLADTDIEHLINVEVLTIALGDTDQEAAHFPWTLFIIEIVVVLIIFGHITRAFPEYWSIWMILSVVILSFAYFENRKSGRKEKNILDHIEGEEAFYLDKAWHGIHFLLTGSAWEGDAPLHFLVAGGEEVKDSDVGYGPGRVFTSAQVKDIDAALQAISKEEFESRYDPVGMMEANIYPNIWDRDEEEDDLLEYVSDNFVRLKQYIHTIAGKGMGMVVGLS